MIPNKAFQALACGTPLVTADTPAARRAARRRRERPARPARRPGGAGRRPAQARGRPRRWRSASRPEAAPPTRRTRARRCSAAAGASWSSRRSHADDQAAGAPLDRDRRLRGRLLGALDPAAPRLLDRPLRPREHGPGGLVDRARPPAADHRPARRPGLAARRALRPDPRRLRAALARLAEPGPAARRAGRRSRARRAARLLARAQAPRRRAGRRSASRSPTSPTRRPSG